MAAPNKALTDSLTGIGVSLGAGAGLAVGVALAGGPGLVVGMLAGAAAGLVVGSAVASLRRASAGKDQDLSKPS
jgi:hypothetical protein